MVADRGAAESGTATEPTAAVPNRKPRILVAEDDAEMRRLLVEGLREDGCEVLEALDGVELLAHLGSSMLFGSHGSTREPPDLLVTDVRMPGLTGIKVLSGLRHAGSTLPVIVITAFGDEDTHREAFRHGAVAVFDKPFDILDLRTIVLSALKADRELPPLTRDTPPDFDLP